MRDRRSDTYTLILHQFTNVARLFFELANSTCFRALIRIHQASRDFYDSRVDRWTPLLLENDSWLIIGLCRILEDGRNTNSVDICTLGSCKTFARLPRALDAFRVGVGSSCSASISEAICNRTSDGNRIARAVTGQRTMLHLLNQRCPLCILVLEWLRLNDL